jgi:hypothetical protein
MENKIIWGDEYITVFESTRDRAEQCLIDHGIDADEACTVLQALGYILMDVELYPEER